MVFDANARKDHDLPFDSARMPCTAFGWNPERQNHAHRSA